MKRVFVVSIKNRVFLLLCVIFSSGLRAQTLSEKIEEVERKLALAALVAGTGYMVYTEIRYYYALYQFSKVVRDYKAEQARRKVRIHESLTPQQVRARQVIAAWKGFQVEKQRVASAKSILTSAQKQQVRLDRARSFELLKTAFIAKRSQACISQSLGYPLENRNIKQSVSEPTISRKS